MSKPLGMIASCLALSCAATFASALETSPEKQEVLSLALRGVHFVPNHGQWADADVHFGLRSRGLDVAFRESAFTMHLARQTGSESRDRNDELTPHLDPMLPHGGDSPGDRADVEHLTLTVSFPGSNRVMPEGGEPQTAKFNFFVGGEGREVASDVPSFGAVVYHNLYDGVDLHVMGSDEGVLKYEFHVEPGADYGQIQIAYDGIESLCIDDAGHLRIQTAFGTLLDGAPVVWQEIDGDRVGVETRFGLCDGRVYRILIDGPVDPQSPLVIDPELQWMLYLGGRGQEQGNGIALDADGNVLVSGETSSSSFDGRTNSHHGGTWDGFICKVSREGTLAWMTYVGGSDRDLGRGLTIDETGNIYLTGLTDSLDFEGRVNSYYGQGDAFVVQMDPEGHVAAMVYLGGTAYEIGYSVIPNGLDGLTVVGYTTSPDLVGRSNEHHGDNDGFVARLAPSLQVLWSTFVGGSRSDVCRSVADDGSGNVFLVGRTSSSDFEGRLNSYRGGAYDAFITRISPSGEVQWMTYLGGAGEDSAFGITEDRSQNLLVIGATASNDFEERINTYHGGVMDTFVADCQADGQVRRAVYLGGSGREDGSGILTDENGTIFVAGVTSSIDFEGRSNAYFGGEYDGFVAVLDAAFQLTWMTYVGGSGYDHLYGIVLEGTYGLTGVGGSVSTDFEGSLNSHHGGTWDAAVVRLDFTAGPSLTIEAVCPSGGPIRVAWTDATPGGQVALIFARNTGSFAIPNGRPCAGTALGLGANQLQIAFQGSAGPNGSRTLNSNTGSGACGGYLQLLDLTTCGTSNVVRIE